MSVRLACHSMRHQATHQQPSAWAHQTFQVSNENVVWPLDGLLGAELPAGLSLEAEPRATCCGFEAACGGEDGADRPGAGAGGPETLACRLCLALQHHGRLQDAEAGRNHLVGDCKRVAVVSEDAVRKPADTCLRSAWSWASSALLLACALTCPAAALIRLRMGSSGPEQGGPARAHESR